MASDLADDRRRRVRRELDATIDIEAVDRLDQPDRPDLDELFELVSAARVARGESADEREVLLDQLLPGGEVAARVVGAQKVSTTLRPAVAPDRAGCDGRSPGSVPSPHTTTVTPQAQATRRDSARKPLGFPCREGVFIVADHGNLGGTLDDSVESEAASELRRYRELLDVARDAYVVTDAAGRVIHANRTFETMAGAPNAAPGASVTAVIAPEDRRAFRLLLGELGDGGRVSDAEFVLRGASSSSIPVSATAAAELRDSGVREIHWLFSDITTRKRVETQLKAMTSVLEEKVAARTEELKEANEKLEAERSRLARLLERLHDGVITVDRTLTVEFANQAARSLVPAGLDRRAPLPDAWPDVPLRALAASLFEPRAETIEKRLVSANAVLSIVGIPAGASETAVLVIADISERERRERTEREFVTNAAHELQTPLTAIGSAIEVLQSGAKDDPVERDRFLAHIEEGTARLVRLTRALLLLARAQLGTERPRADVVELEPLLREIAAGLAHGEDVEVRVECENGVTATVNRELAEQALLNLARNAAKFTLSGLIALSARRVDDRWVSIDVEDTGPGIPADRLEHVFERFYRGEDGAASGFGIGLAIAWQAARALGGRIEIASPPGGGTTARLLLPSVPADVR